MISLEYENGILLEQTLVVALESVHGLAGRVCPVEDIQKSTGPLVVYEQQTDEDLTCIGGSVGLLTATFKLHVFHGTYRKMRLLAEQVKAKVKSLRQHVNGALLVEEVTVVMAHPDILENKVQLFRRAYNVTIQYQFKEDT